MLKIDDIEKLIKRCKMFTMGWSVRKTEQAYKAEKQLEALKTRIKELEALKQSAVDKDKLEQVGWYESVSKQFWGRDKSRHFPSNAGYTIPVFIKL